MEIAERISDDSHITTVPAPASLPRPPKTFSDDATTANIKDDEWFARRRRKREALVAQLEEEEEAVGREPKDIPPNAYGNSRFQLVPPAEALKAATLSHNPALKIVERPLREGALTDTTKPLKTKQVSFADDALPKADPSALPKGEQKEAGGDVVPGRLRDAKNESLRALKMDVVERAPHPAVVSENATPGPPLGKLSFTPRKVHIRQAEVDSDDEDQTLSMASQSDSDQDDDEDDDDDQGDNDGEGDDWDEAMFQRELALAYYEQRGMLEQMRQSVQTPPTPNYSPDLGSWEQEVRA
jgi:hypothetical protein